MSVGRAGGKEFEGLNSKMLANGATWSPQDDNGGKSTWNGDPAGVPDGGVGYLMNEIDVPDGYLMVLYGLRMFVSDHFDENLLPGDYTEHWVYKGDAGVSYGDSDWVDRTADDDFLAHFSVGTGGSETVGGEYGSSPESLEWTPPRPVLSATGVFSEAWEGDSANLAANKGEWSIHAYFDLVEADRDQIIQELLGER
jgi:hypothetical protein